MLRVFYAAAPALREPPDGVALSAYRRQKLARIKNPVQYALSLGVELLLIEALKTLGPIGLPLDIKTGPAGKPALVGGPCFNLSHSGELVLCALSDKPVGADVQRLSRYQPALVSRFFSAAESRWLEQQQEQNLAFTTLWSLKESAVKLYGAGIAGAHLDSFTIRAEKGGQASISTGEGKLWYTELEDYVISVCSACYEKPERFKKLEL